MVKKNGEKLRFSLAFRDHDYVTIGEDGLGTLRLLLGIGRSEHSKWLKKIDKGEANEWSEHLRFSDKTIERLFFSAKKVIVEVDWDKWADIEKQLTIEAKKLFR